MAREDFFFSILQEELGFKRWNGVFIGPQIGKDVCLKGSKNSEEEDVREYGGEGDGGGK